MKCVGLDLSLTSTGVAIATPDGAITDRITTKATRRVGKGDQLTLLEREARLTTIRIAVCAHAQGADLIVVEGPSYGSVTPHQHERSGLWWLVVHGLLGRGYPVVEVPPSTRMKYATGRGNANKDDVLSAVIRRYPHVDVNGNDEADALILAAMGARWLGHPLEPAGRVPRPGQSVHPGLPVTHLAAMDAVHWPDQDGDAA